METQSFDQKISMELIDKGYIHDPRLLLNGKAVKFKKC